MIFICVFGGSHLFWLQHFTQSHLTLSNTCVFVKNVIIHLVNVNIKDTILIPQLSDLSAFFPHGAVLSLFGQQAP